MPEITDPEILAALSGGSTGGDARTRMSTPESKRADEEYGGIPALKNLLRMNMQAEIFNRRIPTGRFAANVSEAGQQFPTSWQPSQIGDYQAFLGLRQKMMKPSMGLMGSKVSASENNAVAERQQNLMAIPGPQNERSANTFLNNDIFKSAQMKLRRDTFADDWRKRYGTTMKRNPRGQTVDEALNEYMDTGPGAKWRDKPLGQYLDEATRKRAATGKPPGIINYEDLK